MADAVRPTHRAHARTPVSLIWVILAEPAAIRSAAKLFVIGGREQPRELVSSPTAHRIARHHMHISPSLLASSPTVRIASHHSLGSAHAALAAMQQQLLGW